MKIWLRAFISISLIVIIWLTIIYVFLPAVKKATPPKNDSHNELNREAPQKTIVNPKQASTATQPEKPLNLEISPTLEESIENPKTDSEGPQLPAPSPLPPPSSEKSVLPEDLTSKKTKEDELLYNYQGTKDEQHKLMLGVKKGDVTVKTDIQAGDKEQTVQQIQIEINLP
ncbi:hypothetical protein THMIRHAM_03840 [Thiomicrorhabdus immobilis]|uniref:Uncharacterized protein n=1 Tax=Thiomicrorhabdus immobilis TaxID=2791037 RepID=A0ABN6CY95_9GAMM|nr:hypothetical protein [Thiomicrorhabdus immobilis]BCN92599.1 hypothetical protein THMIRHAM_03840 [Thiomicrorhabdus immobilis]